MNSIPRVAVHTRELISREFDDRGPQACVTEISRELAAHNPELLDMATRCARDVGEPQEMMSGFCMFYRLLTAAAAATGSATPPPPGQRALSALPRVTARTREAIVGRIDAEGSDGFTRTTIEQLESGNPELLQMAHNFAAARQDYLGVMQGFALLYASLLAQSEADRARLQ